MDSFFISMISVQEAQNLINQIPILQKVEFKELVQARNYYLAKDIFSPINMPHFRQSAMDGFAINNIDNLTFDIIGEFKAGDQLQISLDSNEAIKIFTGAAVPKNANAIIPIEKCEVVNEKLLLNNYSKLNENIRPIGEQIKIEELALQKGSLLTPAAIGYLTGLGITKVEVFQKPKIAIIITGNELINPGEPLQYGKMYESNSIMLQQVLFENNFNDVELYQVKDDFLQTKEIISKAMEVNDIVIISGGISVGDYDFVAQALKENNVDQLFYKINQKPGKPLYVGNKNNKVVFALPGNPAAALTCFYIYILPFLTKYISGNNSFFNCKKAKLKSSIQVNNIRAQFLKARVNNGEVEILSHQNSSMLNSFSIANCLVYLKEGDYFLDENSIVDIYHI